jgi:glycosyltransferase involved in cell wall biosynthesis
LSDTPVVSVIMPVYNVAPYIAEAVRSALAQTYPAREIIIVNDGSQDTPELERALEPYRDRVSYQSQPNRGVGAARNAAIAAARGSLLAFLDGDDVWKPEFLASQVSFLERGGYDMVYANAELFGATVRPGLTFMDQAPSQGTADLEGLLGLSCQPLTSSTVVRKQLVTEAGLFDETIRRGQDYDLWVRLALRGARIGYQRAVLAGYRQREDSLSGDEIERLDRAIGLYEGLRRKLPLPAGAVRLLESRLRSLQAARQLEEGKRSLLAGDYPSAAAFFRTAWREHASLRLLGVRVALAIAPGVLQKIFARLRGR